MTASAATYRPRTSCASSRIHAATIRPGGRIRALIGTFCHSSGKSWCGAAEDFYEARVSGSALSRHYLMRSQYSL